MAQATLLQLLNVPDDDDEDDLVDVEEVDFQRYNRRQRHRHHRQLDPYSSSEFDTFTSDLLPDDLFFPDSLYSQASLIDSLNDDVSEPESVVTSADLFDRESQVNFVMDLLHQRVEQSQLSATHAVVDPEFSGTDQGFDSNVGITEGNAEIDPTHLDLDLGLGFLGEPGSPDVENSGFVAENFDGEELSVTGLRVVDMGSESDSDLSHDVEIEFNADDEDEENACADLSVEEGDDDPSLGLFWDSFQIEDHREVNEDLEWEEVDEGVDERDVLSMFLDDDDDVSVMAREDMIGVMAGLEWEVLLNVQNLEANAEIGTEGFNELNFSDHEHDEYNYTTEYDMLFGQFPENESMIGKPPAAKDVVKNLPLVVFSEEDLKKSDLICAVCKDDMGVCQNARQLPCNHRYHGDCILPWLGIRNTCPVCRYELPTDDAEYERRKRGRRAALVN